MTKWSVMNELQPTLRKIVTRLPVINWIRYLILECPLQWFSSPLIKWCEVTWHEVIKDREEVVLRYQLNHNADNVWEIRDESSTSRLIIPIRYLNKLINIFYIKTNGIQKQLLLIETFWLYSFFMVLDSSWCKCSEL